MKTAPQDLNAYQSGRVQGLREFCQPQNGFRLGDRGAEYSGFCPADLAGDFEAAYRDGFELYGLRRAQDDMITASALVIDSDADKAARAQALLDVKRPAERQGMLKTQIRQRETDHLNFQRDLDHYLAVPGPR